MLAVYGIGILIFMILMALIIWQLGAVGFVFLILGALYIITSNKSK